MSTWHRQWLQPRQFRVSQATHLATDGSPQSIQDAVVEIARLLQHPPSPGGDKALAAGFGTSIWRWGERLKVLIKTAHGEVLGPAERLRKARTMAVDNLRACEVEVLDYVDQPYDPGSPMHVVGRENLENLPVPTVVQTNLPTIYYRGMLIQEGEIVVGMPIQREELR